MKKAIIGVMLAGVVLLAGVIALRLSADALAMIVGVILGIIALAPTLALAMLMLRRNQQQSEDRAGGQGHQPPVIVVSGGGYAPMLPPGQPANQSGMYAGMIPPPAMQPERDFRMMGAEDTDTVELRDNEWSPQYP